MKKFAAILCTAVMSLGMVSSVFANPSIKDVTIEEQEVIAAEESAELIPEGKKLAVRKADPEKYESSEAAEVVTKLNDPKTMITMEEMLDVLKVDTTEEIKTESGNAIQPLEYEPVSEFADLVLTDGTTVEYDINGEVKAVKVTLKVEALKNVKDIKNCVLMQINPKNGNVYFIEIDEESYNPETGEITVTFPCLGPFCVLEKAE